MSGTAVQHCKICERILREYEEQYGVCEVCQQAEAIKDGYARQEHILEILKQRGIEAERYGIYSVDEYEDHWIVTIDDSIKVWKRKDRKESKSGGI